MQFSKHLENLKLVKLIKMKKLGQISAEQWYRIYSVEFFTYKEL